MLASASGSGLAGCRLLATGLISRLPGLFTTHLAAGLATGLLPALLTLGTALALLACGSLLSTLSARGVTRLALGPRSSLLAALAIRARGRLLAAGLALCAGLALLCSLGALTALGRGRLLLTRLGLGTRLRRTAGRLL